MMPSSEFMDLQSLAKLGIYTGMVEGDADIFTSLWIDTAPSAMGIADPKARDKKRAQIVRERTKNIS